MGILDRYTSMYEILQGETFYEGIIDIEPENSLKILRAYFEEPHKNHYSRFWLQCLPADRH